MQVMIGMKYVCGHNPRAVGQIIALYLLPVFRSSAQCLPPYLIPLPSLTIFFRHKSNMPWIAIRLLRVILPNVFTLPRYDIHTWQGIAYWVVLSFIFFSFLQIWMNYVSCAGHERTLFECYNYWDYQSYYARDANVICYNNGEYI